MKAIKLQKLTLTNFRGVKSLEINFNENATQISGENGTGKSTVFNSFLWLLFGKDAQDRKDFNIQPTQGGEPDRRVESTVEAILSDDGETITLRRVLKPNWVKPRGQVEPVFKGNVTETYWNETPVNVTEYAKRVAGIINDSVFKMITNPLFFANMKWQNQREQLFQLAGTITDEEIAAQNSEFSALLDSISGKSFADFKKEIANKKKRLKDDLEQIQPRIDQTKKLMPENADFSALEKEVADIDKQIADIDTAIADKAAAIRGQYEAIQAKQAQINALQQQRTKVLYDEQTRANEAANNANAARRDIESNIKATEREIETLQRSVNMTSRELEQSKAKLEEKQNDVANMRNVWFNTNAEEYKAENDKIVCPLSNLVCNNPDLLAKMEENQNAARAKFNEDKAKRLAQITQNGKDLSVFIKEVEQDIANTSKALENAKNDLQNKRNELVSLNQNITTMQVVVADIVKPEEVQECVTLTGQIKAIEAEIAEMEKVNPVDSTDMQTTKRELTAKRDDARKQLGNRELIQHYVDEVNKLEKQGKDLAQQIANLEREEYTIQEFSKARVDECERRINGLFTMVRFQLFDYNIDDSKRENPIETCVPLVDGVPFPVANTAGQVNAGLDIINALCKFYDVSAPIFIDGRESVNSIIDTDSQIINLVVSHDKNLQIK